MDTPTQALLGAVVGQAGFSHKLGKRALWWGALGGAIPDFDLLPIAFLGPWGEFLYHRGPTHALWFGPVAGSVLGYAVWRWYAGNHGNETGGEQGSRDRGTQSSVPHPGHPAMLASWVGLFVLALLSQPFLDVFTTYGTQLLTPFSNRRFALDAVPIIDPFYSLILIAALVVWIRTSPGRRARVGRRAAAVALVLSTSYLFYGLWLNDRAEREVRSQLAQDGISGAQVHIYPTIFQVYLRRVVVRIDNELLVGAITLWKPGPVAWHRSSIPDHPLIEKLAETRAGRLFDWFAAGEVVPRVIELNEGFVVEFDDLRYGFFEEPDQGIWGIRGKFDLDGNLQGEVVRFQRNFSVNMETFVALWRATFGLIPEAPRLEVSRGLSERGEASPQTWVSGGD